MRHDIQPWHVIACIVGLALVVFGLSCASSQPRVCSLSSIQLKEGREADLVNASRSGSCDAYPLLSECPAAQQVNAEWDALGKEWTACTP